MLKGHGEAQKRDRNAAHIGRIQHADQLQISSPLCADGSLCVCCLKRASRRAPKGGGAMAGFDDDVSRAPPKKQAAHEIGQPIDALSAEELAERIQLLKAEIARLEAAIAARQATKEAASAFFKR